MSPAAFRHLADAVLVVHLALVLFVVIGLLLIVVGNLRGWSWVNRPWFRVAHLAAIAVVVIQSWLGMACPLTLLESWLRAQAGAQGYAEGFIQDWVQRLLFYDAPGWVFTACYTLFGLLVVAAWWYFPPREMSSEPPPRGGQPRGSRRT